MALYLDGSRRTINDIELWIKEKREQELHMAVIQLARSIVYGDFDLWYEKLRTIRAKINERGMLFYYEPHDTLSEGLIRYIISFFNINVDENIISLVLSTIEDKNDEEDISKRDTIIKKLGVEILDEILASNGGMAKTAICDGDFRYLIQNSSGSKDKVQYINICNTDGANFTLDIDWWRSNSPLAIKTIIYGYGVPKLQLISSSPNNNYSLDDLRIAFHNIELLSNRTIYLSVRDPIRFFCKDRHIILNEATKEETPKTPAKTVERQSVWPGKNIKSKWANG